MTAGLPAIITAGDDDDQHTGTRILVGDDRQLVWTNAGANVQVTVRRLDGRIEFVLATAQRGFSYEAALAAYALLKEAM
jgi:hypothetical protein